MILIKFMYNFIIGVDNLKYAYVTVLSTDNYFDGVLALYESLKRTKPKYKDFVVVVNDEINPHIITELSKRNIIIKKMPKIDASPLVNNKSYTYWNHTFDKLNIFELTEYDKIVYLDSDMYIANNIDELFDFPHMSGAIAGKGMVNEWSELGSGLMVIVPKKGTVDGMKKILCEYDFGKDIGDQDIINKYFDWPNKNLAISEKYNLFAEFLDYYVNNLGYKKDDISVVHFIGGRKPWMMSDEEVKSHRKNKIDEGKVNELYFFDKYLELINEVRNN